MQLIVNQQPCEFAAPHIDVPTLLQSRGIKATAVAVAINGEVVPRRKWDVVRLSDGDKIELVKVVAGGAWDDDPLVIADQTFQSRLLMGTGRFVSPALLRACSRQAGSICRLRSFAWPCRFSWARSSARPPAISAAWSTALYRLSSMSSGRFRSTCW